MHMIMFFPPGLLRERRLGAVLCPLGPPDHWRLQDVQVPEELHLHQGGVETAHVAPAATSVPAALLEGYARLWEGHHDDGPQIRETHLCKWQYKFDYIWF